VTDTPRTFEEWYTQADTFNSHYEAAEAAWDFLAAEVAAKDRRIAALESEAAVERAALLREAAGECEKHGRWYHGGQEIAAAILALDTGQPALDRHVAERYITREEHNNIIRMNETVHKRDVAERVKQAVMGEAEWWAKNSIEDTLQSRRERSQRLTALRAAAGAPEDGK
jgi:hypothetical protein